MLQSYFSLKRSSGYCVKNVVGHQGSREPCEEAKGMVQVGHDGSVLDKVAVEVERGYVWRESQLIGCGV